MKKNWRKGEIEKVLAANPKAYLVANKYKVLRVILTRRYPMLLELNQEALLDIIFDAVNGNRDWQMLTEGHDVENKNRLEQEFKIGEGYHDFPKHVINTPPRGDG